MKNKKILQHYSMESKKITPIDCVIYSFRYLMVFIKLNIDMNYIQKIILIIRLYVSFLNYFIKKTVIK